MPPIPLDVDGSRCDAGGSSTAAMVVSAHLANVLAAGTGKKLPPDQLLEKLKAAFTGQVVAVITLRDAAVGVPAGRRPSPRAKRPSPGSPSLQHLLLRSPVLPPDTPAAVEILFQEGKVYFSLLRVETLQKTS